VHMPRAAELFQAAGADFVPASADYDSHSGPISYRTWLFPRGSALTANEHTFHEYLGRAWAALGGG